MLESMTVDWFKDFVRFAGVQDSVARTGRWSISPCSRDMPENEGHGTFPEELFLHIFGFLDVRSLLASAQVCHSWRAIGQDRTLWRALCFTDSFVGQDAGFLPNWLPSWKEAYRFFFECKFRVFSVGEIKNGRGCFVWSNGAKYEGEWLNDKEHGRGKKTWLDGATFEGEWDEGKFSGIGTHTWASGSRYHGQWSKHKRNGLGKNLWPQKDTYEGEWFEDQKYGFGAYTWADGRVYRGYWKQDKRCGQGKFIWSPMGYRYEGEWKDDRGHGFGRFYWENGDFYEGDWHNGKRSGKGKFFTSDGKIYLQEWNEEREFNANDKGDLSNEITLNSKRKVEEDLCKMPEQSRDLKRRKSMA